MARPRGSGGTKQLTTEERMRVRILYFDASKSQAEIHSITGYTKAQIRTAIRADDATAGRSTGRPRTLTPKQEDELVQYVTSSKKARRMGFLELSMVLFAGTYGMWLIKHALYRLGFRRRVARKKPPITEKNRKLRLAWAQEHEHWTPEPWAKILWTDETWVTGGPHRKQYVTRRQGEEWDPTCIVEKHQRKGGWMFWGCFSGLGKGPGIFWEKDWGKINADSYRAHTVPVIHGWVQLCKVELGEDLILMQDGAPGHAATETKEDLRERGIIVMDCHLSHQT